MQIYIHPYSKSSSVPEIHILTDKRNNKLIKRQTVSKKDIHPQKYIPTHKNQKHVAHQIGIVADSQPKKRK